jgi:hypothetical protein
LFFKTGEKVNRVNLKEIKKALMTNRVRISQHTKERMDKRGYMRKDIISCILTGSVVERQVFNNNVCLLIEGKDTDNLPIAVVIGRDKNHPNFYIVVTVMPPIAEIFKTVI